MYLMYRVMIVLSLALMYIINHVFAYSYLIYCVELWDHAGDRLLYPLFLVQKK